MLQHSNFYHQLMLSIVEIEFCSYFTCVEKIIIKAKLFGEITVHQEIFYCVDCNSSFTFNFSFFYERINIFLAFFHKGNWVFLIFKYKLGKSLFKRHFIVDCNSSFTFNLFSFYERINVSSVFFHKSNWFFF
jgi:hypothetical protein